MASTPHRQRVRLEAVPQPPIAGMPIEVWSWLRESMAVRPHVVARVRAQLDAGEHVSCDQVARAMLEGPFRDVA